MRLTFGSGVKLWLPDGWSFQLLFPKWSAERGDYYLMFPTVFRVLIGASDRRETGKQYGIGFVILGFGFAVIRINLAEKGGAA